MVINLIRWNPICQHTQSGGDLLVGDMPKFSSGISPLVKKLVIIRQILHGMLEQVDDYSKTATKIAFRKCWILHRIGCGHDVSGGDSTSTQHGRQDSRGGVAEGEGADESAPTGAPGHKGSASSIDRRDLETTGKEQTPSAQAALVC
jgi:hypothetical protein